MLGLPGRMVCGALTVLAAAGLLLTCSAAARADTGERITTYDVDVAVHSDGTAHVRESITYDFGANAKHGIERRILYSTPAGKDRYRNIDVTGVRASSPDAPARTEVSDDGTYQDVRVGDPDRTITGVHSYVVEYDTDHVATKTGGGVRYAWNAIGDEWDVPISGITVHLRGPAAMSDAKCFAGAAGSTASCAGATASGNAATFDQPAVDADQGVTVQADLPAGSVAVAPKYQHVDSDDGSGEPDASVIPSVGSGLTIGVLLLICAAVCVYGQKRRAEIARRPRLPGLPDGMTPGLAANLVETGRDAEVMGTLLDLARRGFLRIDDIEGWRKDWMLTRTADWDPGLAPHEQAVLRGLFTGRDQINVKKLHNSFYRAAAEASEALEKEADRRGWKREPYERWIVYGCSAPFFLYAVAEVLARDLNGWPFLLAASALTGVLIVDRIGKLYRLTPAGEDARRQVGAFRKWLVEPGPEQRDAEWTLPYAVAFKEQYMWEHNLGGGAAPRPAFYSGVGLLTFTTSAGSTMTSSPSSGGSGGGGIGGGGSVGGGGGGGGGGSW